jgi:hypothetical protein
MSNDDTYSNWRWNHHKVASIVVYIKDMQKRNEEKGGETSTRYTAL